MFKLLAICALAAVSSSHVVPMSYQQVVWYHLAHEGQGPKVEMWTEKPKSAWGDRMWSSNQWAEKSWEPKAEWNRKSWEQQALENHKSWESQFESKEQKKDEQPNNYEYGYEVHDEKTGDIKRQSETASNGVVKGQYSLIDADGFRRVVEYTADDKHGFQASVKREPFKVPQSEKKIEEPRQVRWW